MAILFNVSAKAGEYTDSKGEKKVRWHKCGVAIESQKSDAGMAINIESLPTNFDGWLQLYKPKEKEAKEAAKADGYQPEPKDEDIPF